jgi:hypothetical protein
LTATWKNLTCGVCRSSNCLIFYSLTIA